MDREWIGNGSVCSRKLFASIIFLSLLGVSNAWGVEYELITSEADLIPGEKYLIGAGTSGTVQFINTTSNTDNRKTTGASVSSSTVTKTDALMAVTLGGCPGAWTFYTNSYGGTAGYLNATSTTSNNYLKVVAALDAYAFFTITFSSSKAVITCTGKTSRNIMRKNSSSAIISCYSSGQNDIYLYKEVPASTYTVTYSVGSGTCGTANATEASKGAGVTLPSASPSSACASDGWEFAGWAEASCSETHNQPTLYASGSTYHPHSNTTLYAVYALPSTKYKKVTSAADLTSGKYLIVCTSSTAALKNAIKSNYYLDKTDVSISSNTITNPGNALIWEVTKDSRGVFHFYNANQSKWLDNYLSGSYHYMQLLSAMQNGYGVTINGSGYALISSYHDSGALIYYNTTNTRFAGAASSGTKNLHLYKKDNTYNSTPSCASCTADPSVGNASLNGSFNMTTSTSAIGVQSGTCSTGNAACDWTDYGFVWSDGANTTTPTVSNNKVQVNTTGSATSWTGSVTPSGSTTPTSWTTGHTYYVRTYGKNSKASATYYYGSAWSFTPYLVTFNKNDGGATTSTQYVQGGVSTNLTSNSFSRTGYTFNGWNTDADGTSGTGYTNGQSVNLSANLTLYAKWTANEYTITLNQDLTPTSAGTTSITATYNSNSNLTSAITKPTKTGWTFAGYFTAKNGGGTQIIGADGNVIASVSGYTDASKNWIGTSDVTLYAKWTCTITWSVSGATNVYSAQTLTYNASSTKIASVPGPPSPASYCGDKFVGWTTEANVSQDDDDGLELFTTVAGSPELKTVGNTTFYAVFADYDE